MGLFDIFKKRQDASGEEPRLDFSGIDSNEKAQGLFAKGQLVKLYLMPLDFGGHDSPLNTVYVPAGANRQKEGFDSKIYDLLEKGLQLRYSASPEYKGNSFIPSRVVIQVNGDQTLTEVVEVW